MLLPLLFLHRGLVTGFPGFLNTPKDTQHLHKRIAPLVPFPEYPGLATHATFSSFDASTQSVSTTGSHAFIPPSPSDIRGPCPGLNAAANHGYLPRNGIADAESIATDMWELYSLDVSATTFLQVLTQFFDGDPVSGRWSIGYHSPDMQSLGALGDLLGNETGICAYGYLKTEGDASITRGDWLAPTMNSNCASYAVFAQELLDLALNMTDEGNITPRMLAQHSSNRKRYSIATNPYYFSPPYAGVAFAFGAHMFTFQLLANHSCTHPRGVLTPEVFESWFSYTRDDEGELNYTYGQERIPENWYKRSPSDLWTLTDILLSTAQQCASYPSNCQIGGNTGTVNSFSGIDLGNLTGGLVNVVEDLAEPARLGCFLRQAVQAEVPGFLSNVFEGAGLVAANSEVLTTLVPALEGLGTCPGLPEDKSVFGYEAQFPGARLVGEGPRAAY